MNSLSKSSPFCQVGNHPVKSSIELLPAKHGGFVCRSCLRKGYKLQETTIPQSLRQKILQDLHLLLKISQTVVSKFDSELQEYRFRVLLGKLIDHLENQGMQEFELLNIQKTTFKHETVQIRMKYRCSDQIVEEMNFYLKFMKRNEAELEELTDQYLDLLQIPRTDVYLYSWFPEETIFLSPHYDPDSYPIYDSSLPLENNDRSILKKQFSQVLAVWHLYGKQDYLHNQLISYKPKLSLVQHDHENSRPPLCLNTHPMGLERVRLKKNSSKDQWNQIKSTIDNLGVAYSIDKQETPDPEIVKMFLDALTVFIQNLENTPQLQRIIEKKIQKVNAVDWNKALIQFVNNTNFTAKLKAEFRADFSELIYIKKYIRQIRGPWRAKIKNDFNNLEVEDPEQAEKERQKGYARFPHEIPFENTTEIYLQMKTCFAELNLTSEMIEEKIEYLEKQVKLTHQIWTEILLEGKILLLTEANITWDPYTKVKDRR